ncbi:MAG: fibronectin type III domain-containing protein [Thermoplasmata archaeon]
MTSPSAVFTEKALRVAAMMGEGLARGRRSRRAVAVGFVLLLLIGLSLFSGLPAAPTEPSSQGRGIEVGRSAGPAPVAGPYVAYGNVTIVLPEWNSLSQFAWNCNTNVSVSVNQNCFVSPRLGFAGSQVPLVSWTASGAFYVNASFDLVYYSFLTGTVTRIAPWLPLFDNTMDYAGATNTEYITADGSYVYEFGCLTVSCRTGGGVEVTSYAVNVSTGRTFEHTWSDGILTGVSAGRYSTYWNAQTNLVGLDGNDSILTLTVTWVPLGGSAHNGTVWAYNLWTGVEWKLGDLPIFEANNLYWLPEYSQFFDVSADGTNFDEVVQAILSGNPADPTLSTAGPFVYSNGHYPIGGVDGLWVDVLSQQVAFEVDWQGSGQILSIVAQLGPGAVVTGFPNVTGPDRPGTVASVLAGEHRPSVVTGPPAFSPPQLGNPDGWLSDPLSTSTYQPTNVSQSMTAWNVDGSLFYNTSYSILTGSDQCERVSTAGTSCPLLGTSHGSRAGTLWWTWRLGLPQFPFPSDAPLAESVGPPPMQVTAVQTPVGVEVNWTLPSNDPDPIINYTVAWGASVGTESNRVSLPGNATHCAFSGLASGESVYYQVDAWNLHGFTPNVGKLTLGNEVVPAAPVISATFDYDPRVPHPGAANLTVVLTEGLTGNGPIVNDTLVWGTAPGSWSHYLSGQTLGLPVGRGRVVWTVSDLPAGATYYFSASSWNPWGESPESNVVSVVVPVGGNSTPPNSVVPILEVAGATIAVVTGGAVLVILRNRRNRRSRPPVSTET